MKVSLVSLGCPKNLVDSEEMLGVLSDAGCEISSDPAGADVVVVNTCGFIESAKEESIGAILDAVNLKTQGVCKRVIVTGCLAQRYAKDLAEEIPEVDAFLGVGRIQDLPELLEGAKKSVCQKEQDWKWIESRSRVRSTPPWLAYLKISEGCNNRCAYCAIPDIRGPFRSRPVEFVLEEARKFASEGVREICLVGQDITLYGADLEGGWSLERLLGELVKIEGISWIRLLYCYPTRITDGLIEMLAKEPKIVKYMDIPFQHGDDGILSAMNRRGTRDGYLELIRKLKRACPEIALRSSFIIGFPGETAEAFENLLGFAEEIRFDRVGAFVYSCEEGTPAASFESKVSASTARKRYKRFMELQQRISWEKNQDMIGHEIDVLVESVDASGEGTGRSYRDAPEIDGSVFVRGPGVVPGQIIRARIVEADAYDLKAEALG